MPDPHDTKGSSMPDTETNGAISRIKRVLEKNQTVDQKLVNDLLLEGMVENNQLIRFVASEFKKHADEHKQVGIQHDEYKDTVEDWQKVVNDRMKAVENVVFFPVKHPRVFTLVMVITFLLVNFWFISGFRQLLLQSMNAPDWLIQLLVPGYMPQ